MKVRDVFTRNPVTARADESVLKSAHLMRSEHVGDVIVVERRDGKNVPVGILTDRDIVVALLAQGVTSLEEVEVGDAMTDVVVIAAEDDDLDGAINNMKSNGIRRMPVVDERDRLTGILTYDDVVRFLAERLATVAAIVPSELSHEMSERK